MIQKFYLNLCRVEVIKILQFCLIILETRIQSVVKNLWPLSGEVILSLRSKVSIRPNLEIHDFAQSAELLASSRVHHVPVAHRFFADDGMFQLYQLVFNCNQTKKQPLQGNSSCF
ncbi:hypothetical protein ATN92_04905 [Companilactobacillus bobalius]|nr:hypothetical protein ATN92_04905 [Companilactobacillus bobalius]